MKCPSCGTWYPKQKIFCLTCGELLSEGDGHVRMGSYVLLDKIGQGGVGVVYSAEHMESGAKVAIKILNQAGFSDITHIQRFRREITLHKKFKHPNIVEFLDIYEEGESLALIMEYITGCSLGDYINHRGILPLGEIIHISLEILSALEMAHQSGVIHRDIKPSNIFITETGVTKLMDFGLAKSMFGGEDITNSGITLGTYLYMSPEQILNQDVTALTDLYAFGIVLYRLCTSVLPFIATDGGEFEIMEKQVRQPPQDPMVHNPDMPKKLAELIMQLLEKKPEDRPKYCAQVKERLLALGEPSVPFSIGPDAIPFSEVLDTNKRRPSILEMLNSERDGFTVSLNSLHAAFAVESPVAPENPPFDMRTPPSISKTRLKHLRIAISNIPTLPEIWNQIQDVFENPESSPADLAQVISQDAALKKKVLKECHSSLYLPAGSQEVNDLAIALTLIGMGAAETLILSVVAQDYNSSFKPSAAVRRIWFHGQAISIFARTLSHYSNVVNDHAASMFGLLHDIGKLVILHTEPDEKLEALATQIAGGKDSLSAEMDVLGYSHIDAGMMLALHWKLPRELHRFIYYHHFPCWQSPTTWPPDMQAPIMLIHMAHLTLSTQLAAQAKLNEGEGRTYVRASKDDIWQSSVRTHVKESESILNNPLHLPLKDEKLYNQLHLQLERLQQSFPDLYPDLNLE